MMKKANKKISAISMGVLIGTIIGVALDNLGLWLSLGIAIGAAISFSKDKVGSQN